MKEKAGDDQDMHNTTSFPEVQCYPQSMIHQ